MRISRIKCLKICLKESKLFRQSVGNESLRADEGILLPRLRQGHRTSEVYYRTPFSPFALLPGPRTGS